MYSLCWALLLLVLRLCWGAVGGFCLLWSLLFVRMGLASCACDLLPLLLQGLQHLPQQHAVHLNPEDGCQPVGAALL